MTERPILFSGPMVRAILNGRKTQTRRVVKPGSLKPGVRAMRWENYDANYLALTHACPYGVSGDRLWVRERALYWTGGVGGTTAVCYQDEARLPKLLEDAERVAAIKQRDAEANAIFGNWRWRPSIHMPRWASRITLEIVSVRVERLNEINLHDAFAEGCPADCGGHADSGDWFEWLWNSINADKHPWDSNPWVWVVEFKKLDSALEAKEPADAR